MRRLLIIVAIVGVAFVVIWSGLSFAQGAQTTTGDARSWLLADYVKLTMKALIGGLVSAGAWHLVRRRR